MVFSVIGGDKRQIEAARHLRALGHEVSIFGLPDTDGLLSTDSVCSAVCGADAVVLPLPCSRDGMTVVTSLTHDVIFLQDILQCKPKFIFAGMIKKQFEDDLNAAGIPHCDYYNDSTLIYNNAVLTAESAIGLAVNGTDGSLYNSKALVIGYGRIGERLSEYLKALGAAVTATSRDKATLARIKANGCSAINTNDLKSHIADFDYIFNTAPSPLLDSFFFSHCKKDAFVCDLATDSGIDLAAASKHGINAAVYSGLPGKSSPKTAAVFITEVILENLNNITKTEDQ